MNINKVITEKLPIAVLAIFIAAIAVLLPRGLEKYDVSTFKKPTFTVQESSTNTE